MVIEREAEVSQDGELMRLDPAQVIPWPGLNPRTRFDAEKHRELVDSVRRSGGNFQPAVVAPAQEGDVPYWLVIGERRLRACREAGVPLLAIVRPLTYREALELALLENLDREDLTPLDEARGYQKLIAAGIKQRDLAERVGRSQPHIANRVRLLELPDEILALIDDGILEHTHARDYLLPFIGIPEEKRAKLFERVAEAIRGAAEEEFADDDEDEPIISGAWVRSTVAEIAEDLSRPVTGHAWDDDRPLFDPEEHESCTCNGPRFRYGWGDATVRCFDDEWWEAAQARAKARLEEEEERAKDKIEAAAQGDLRVLSEGQLDRLYDWKQRQSVDDCGSSLDPAELGESGLVLVKDGYRKGYRLVCVDMDAVKRAKSAANKERKRLTEERTAERARQDLEAAAKSELEPWMLAEILCSRPYDDSMIEVGREIGLDMGKHGELDDALRALPPDQLLTFFKVLAIRCKRGDLGWRDPIKTEIDGILKQRYQSRAAALKRKLLARLGEDAGAAEEVEGDEEAATASVQERLAL